MKFLRFLPLFFGFVAFASLANAAQSLAPGTYQVASSQGNALWLNPPTGAPAALKAGQILPEGAVISTDAGAKVVLDFSNGASVVVREKSEIVVTKFAQEAVDPAAAGAGESAVSHTQITLNKGTVANKVKKLRTGSSYEVSTPVGAAGVRGTVFEVYYDPVAKVLEVRTAEGLVVFTNALTNLESPVEAGKKLVVSFEINAQGQLVTNSVILGDLSPEEIADILEIVEENAPVIPPIVNQVLESATILSDDKP